MKNFIEQFKWDWCDVIVDGEDLEKILSVLNDNHINDGLKIGRYDWVGDTKWYVTFRAFTGRMNKVIKTIQADQRITHILIVKDGWTWGRGLRG